MNLIAKVAKYTGKPVTGIGKIGYLNVGVIILVFGNSQCANLYLNMPYERLTPQKFLT